MRYYHRLNVAAERENRLYDSLPVAGHAPVHRLNLHLGVCFDLGCDVFLTADILGLIVFERLLPLCLVSLNFSLGLGTGVYSKLHFRLIFSPPLWPASTFCSSSFLLHSPRHIIAIFSLCSSLREMLCTFSAARFSAPRSCWIPWVWLAMASEKDK